jgi:glycosyl transferase family 2
MPPTITFAIPTHREDRPLKRCLDSIRPQLLPGDEVLVVGDTFNGSLPGVCALVQSYGAQFRYFAFNAEHACWGHCQMNVALMLARCDVIHLNDDDDVWTEDAAELIRKGVETWPGHVLLFRFVSYHGRTLFWSEVGKLERNYIGGHCMVAPNVKSKLGRFSCEYSGDFDWIEQTVNAFGGAENAIWLTDIVAYARP